jgi:hypothetical protein
VEQSYLYYALGERLLEGSETDEPRIEDAVTWLVHAASEPLVRYESVPRVAAGNGALIYAPERVELIGLPEAQYRLWAMLSGAPESQDLADAFLAAAAMAGYALAVAAAPTIGLTE